MASTALMRLSGTVTRLKRIQGISRNSGEPYDFVQVKVLVASEDTTEFTLPRDLSDLQNGAPVKGEKIDYLAEVNINSSGKGLNINVLGDYPADDDSVGL